MEKLKEFLEDYWKIICILLIVIIVVCFIFLRKSKKNKDEETTPTSSSGYSEDMVNMGEDDINGDIWTIPENESQTEPQDIWTIPENELNN